MLAVAAFSGSVAQADGRAGRDTLSMHAAEREIGVVGTVDCGRRSGLRCEIGPTRLLAIWTDDISGHRERITIDVSWIIPQLDAYDQDDLVCLNVRATDDGGWQAVGLSLPCGSPEPTKRAQVKQDQKVDPVTTSSPTNTPRPSLTPTPTPIINLSLTKSGVRGPFSGSGYPTTWTITVTNAGPDIAHNVVVIDRPIEGLTTVTLAVVSQGTYNTATNRWTIGTIGVGQQQTAVITFAPSFGDSGTALWTNEAEVESADERDSNSTPNNNNPAEDDQGRESMPVPL